MGKIRDEMQIIFRFIVFYEYKFRLKPMEYSVIEKTD